MADVDAAFVQKIFDIPKRKRKPDVHHHRHADHLRAGFEVAKWAAFCHPPKLRGCPARLNQFYSDSAIPNAAVRPVEAAIGAWCSILLG